MNDALLITLDVIVFGFIISFSVACIIKLMMIGLNKIMSGTGRTEDSKESKEVK